MPRGRRLVLTSKLQLPSTSFSVTCFLFGKQKKSNCPGKRKEINLKRPGVKTGTPRWSIK
jgi:hypothetical protein